MPLHPRTCSLLYSISCLLDAADGVAARHFDQSTRFGAVLDMVTDRCTTSCLLVFLASAFPRWSLIFQGLISLDLASHYMHMYATLTMGNKGQSHKKIAEDKNWLLRQYYGDNVSRRILETLRKTRLIVLLFFHHSEYCSPFAPLTSSSLSHSISFPSPRLASCRASSRRVVRPLPSTLAVLLSRARFGRHPTAPAPWSWLGMLTKGLQLARIY